MAIVRRSSTLPIPADLAFELAQKIELFEFVVAPFLQIRSIDTPDGIAPGATVSGRLWWLGMVPSWRHSITIVELGDRQIYTNEHGGPVRTWNHRLTFERLDGDHCVYTDEIELGDGLHDAGTRLFARAMFRHRHRRWATLASILAKPTTP